MKFALHLSVINLKLTLYFKDMSLSDFLTISIIKIEPLTNFLIIRLSSYHIFNFFFFRRSFSILELNFSNPAIIIHLLQALLKFFCLFSFRKSSCQDFIEFSLFFNYYLFLKINFHLIFKLEGTFFRRAGHNLNSPAAFYFWFFSFYLSLSYRIFLALFQLKILRT